MNALFETLFEKIHGDEARALSVEELKAIFQRFPVEVQIAAGIIGARFHFPSPENEEAFQAFSDVRRVQNP